MRSWMWLGVLAGVVACNGDDGEGKDDTDGTEDSDTDAGDDTDPTADTDPDTVDTDDDTVPPDEETGGAGADTEDTGGGGASRVAGCAPEYSLVVEPTYADCTATVTERDVVAKVTTVSEYVYDAAGEVISIHQTGKGLDDMYSYSYDADGYLDLLSYDEGNDGVVDITVDYTFTVDASGRVIEVQTDTSDGVSTTTDIESYTWGACSLDLYESDLGNDGIIDSSESYEHYVDGYQQEVDVDGDGNVDETNDIFVDPLTGQTLRYESEYFAKNKAPELVQEYTSYDANGNLLEIQGWLDYSYAGGAYAGYLIDIEATWQYDADQRETYFEYAYTAPAAGALAAETVETVWSCPP